jgi:hypothetical protein
MGQGIGLVGAYGAGAVQDELKQLLAQRIAEQHYREAQQRQQMQDALAADRHRQQFAQNRDWYSLQRDQFTSGQERQRRDDEARRSRETERRTAFETLRNTPTLTPRCGTVQRRTR